MQTPQVYTHTHTYTNIRFCLQVIKPELLKRGFELVNRLQLQMIYYLPRGY
ncbi:hypothetical protein Hanom_Chr05g00450181 [Helianthus anomalus]